MSRRPERTDSVAALLTRLFVRRFIEQDAISPHADRSRTMAVVYGLVLTIGVFYTFFLCVDYLSALVLLPGRAAVRAVSDRFMYIAASLAITALATLAVWDGLALEPRDAAVLGPLPLQPEVITRAKLTAVGLFAAVVCLLMNVGPAVLYPALLTLNIRGLHGSTLLALIAAQAGTVLLAGMFGFVTVLAIRGLARAALGASRFARASAAIHAVLVIGTFVALLLVPTAHPATVRAWVADRRAVAPPATTVLWFLGLHETAVGRLLANTPVVLPPRLPSYPTDDNAIGREEYLALRPSLRALAQRVWWSVPVVALVAVGSFYWTNRRMPEPARSTTPATGGRVRRLLRHLQRGDPEMQAGMHFTWQVLSRSQPHRMLLAAGAAIGLTHACLIVVRGGLTLSSGSNRSAVVFALAPFLVGAVITAARHAVTVPATPAASWVFQTAWRGDERHFLSGVKWGVLALAGSILVVLFPAHLLLMGARTAVFHSLVTMLLAVASLDALLLPYRRVPFACSYLPIENPKLVWPAGVCVLLGLTYMGAAVEQWAADSPGRWLDLIALLCLATGALRGVDRARRRVPHPVHFNEAPAPPTQRLGLHDHVFGAE